MEQRPIKLNLSASHYELLCRFSVGSPSGPVPEDIEDLGVHLQMRKGSVVGEVVLDATEASGHLEFDRTTGCVYLLLSADDVARLHQDRPVVYDLRVSAPGLNDRWPFGGPVRVKTPVTRPFTSPSSP